MTKTNIKSLETHFKLANAFAMTGWIVLATLPSWQYTEHFVLYVCFVSLALLYIFLLQKSIRPKPIQKQDEKVETKKEDKPSFTNLRGVLVLLKNPTGGLAAWVHILAFDLMMGLYIHNEGAAANISHWYLLPCYFFTLMLGPIGLLMFLGLKFFLQI